jgi:tRNA(adenine34) deaminase
MDPSQEAFDKAMMRRCIELSRAAIEENEYPYGTVITLDGKIIAESTNHTVRDDDVSRHAEVNALAEARRKLCRHDLARATLYTNVEPCAMCSFCIREAWVGRVVFGLHSPVMGGFSKWTILRDQDLSDRIPIFGPAPEIVSGFLCNEVQEVWRGWNPMAWEMIKLRGLFSAQAQCDEGVKVLPARAKTFLQHITFAVMKLGRIGVKRTNQKTPA